MNYLALYRKYRPNSFDTIYGQEAIVKTIRTALSKERVSHAYLFCGPRGTGKTTIAKLIGKTVNCMNYPTDVPCGTCQICVRNQNGENVDIIEIDAASNNGIDEIREIRNKVSLVPSSAKYKVYIIDEVHMLTTGAFNALLKTLEEPPAHVIFILATTEPYKIPNTIISRCQRFDFKKINEKEIVRCLKGIIKEEKLDVSDEVLNEIADLSDGGMRDAINLLDQLLSYSDGKINLEDIHLVNGTLIKEELGDFIYSISTKDALNVIKSINDYSDMGKDFVKIVDELIIYIRNLILMKMECIERKRILDRIFEIKYKFLYKFVDALLQIKPNLRNSSYEKLLFELTLLKLISYDNTIEVNEQVDSKKLETKKIEKAEKTKKVMKELLEKEKEPKKEVGLEVSSPLKAKNNEKTNDSLSEEKFTEFKRIRVNNVMALADKTKMREIKKNWEILNEHSVDKKYGVFAGMLLDGKIRVVSDSIILLSYPYTSMAERVNKSLDMIEKLLKKVLGYECIVVAVDDDEWSKIKADYIKKKKNDEKYEVIAEKIKFKDIVIKKEIGKRKNKVTKEVEEAMNIFGEDVVEII